MPTTESPLIEAKADSLQELFDRDPLQLTNDDVATIVAELRAQRERFMVAEKKGKKQAAPANISLADLDL